MLYDENFGITKKQLLINQLQNVKKMNIEFAQKNDVTAVFQILSRCKDNLIKQGIFQWNDQYPDLEHVKNDIKTNSLYKLTHNGQLLGVISFNDFQELEYKTVNWQIKNKPIAVIHRLAVDPLFQGKGYAKKLLAFSQELIEESGFKAIRLDAYSGNKVLLGFYQKLGYKKAGEIFFPNIDLPFICMEKEINRAS